MAQKLKEMFYFFSKAKRKKMSKSWADLRLNELRRKNNGRRRKKNGLVESEEVEEKKGKNKNKK